MSDQQNVFNSGSQPANLPNATAALVLGIISIVGALCYGIVGIICGIIGLVLAVLLAGYLVFALIAPEKL